MAHHQNLLHAQRCHRKLDRSGHAVQAAAVVIGRHQGGNVADGEQLAGSGVEDHGGVGAAVGAGDDHGCRLLTIAQAVENVPGFAITAAAKAPVTSDQILCVVSKIDHGGARLANVCCRSKRNRRDVIDSRWQLA
jgi:hypothetical protein